MQTITKNRHIATLRPKLNRICLPFLAVITFKLRVKNDENYVLPFTGALQIADDVSGKYHTFFIGDLVAYVSLKDHVLPK